MSMMHSDEKRMTARTPRADLRPSTRGNILVATRKRQHLHSSAFSILATRRAVILPSQIQPNVAARCPADNRRSSTYIVIHEPMKDEQGAPRPGAHGEGVAAASRRRCPKKST